MRTLSQHNKKGLVQIFTGDGKGKTTAALGEAARAFGHGLRVCLISFMKGDYPYGEFDALRKLGIDYHSFGFRSLTDPDNLKPEEIEQAKEALAASRQAVLSDKYDLIIMDEINVAVAFGLLGVKEVVELVKSKPDRLELILTGRYANPALIEIADLVTEMKSIKHPYAHGIRAREGVEY